MKEKVKDMFEQVTMPEKTEEKIHNAMTERRKTKRHHAANLAARVATAAAVLAMVLLISPTARAAVTNIVKKVIVFEDSGITVTKEITPEGENGVTVFVDTEAPPFAVLEDGRLYFRGNGENIDITDLLTPEEPYIYTYTDGEGYKHYMAVGTDDTVENYGIHEFLKEEREGMQEWEGWATGYGRNYLDPETNKAYAWLSIVWDELDVPWPMPGA